ncbi:CPBP family intramembrane glutamic endopeptidase [Halalkalicoccus salilacus]|uniref:CPBP family intramembrane glutamic endopeptidase n=1 Tax=Halalkalicoccus TaxID=332246 RepID=UPI0036105DBD
MAPALRAILVGRDYDRFQRNLDFLFALAHGIVAPVTEELAWRGIIQSALVRAEGVIIGIVVTDIVFTAKHALWTYPSLAFRQYWSWLSLSVESAIAGEQRRVPSRTWSSTLRASAYSQSTCSDNPAGGV